MTAVEPMSRDGADTSGNPLSADELRRAADIERAKRTEQQIRAIVRDELLDLLGPGSGFGHEVVNQWADNTSPSDGVVDNPEVGEGAPGPDVQSPGSGPGATTQAPPPASDPGEGYRPAADTPNPPESAAGQPISLLHELRTEEFDHTNESNYIALCVTSDHITERVVRGGCIVSERELDTIPEVWPRSRAFWGPNR